MQRLKKGAEQVRTAWAQARVEAIKTGRVHVFYHSVQGNKFFFAPQASYDDPVQALNQGGPISGGFGGQAVPGGGNAMGGGAMGGNMGGVPATGAAGLNTGAGMLAMEVEQEELPRDITFLGADVRIDQRSSLQLSQAPPPEEIAAFAQQPDDFDASDVGMTQWGMPIFFFPDGTTSSAQLTLENGREQVIQVYLRGLTGLSRVGNVGSAADISTQSQPGVMR